MSAVSNKKFLANLGGVGVKPRISLMTNTCASVSLPAPIPMVGMDTALVMVLANAAGTHSCTGQSTVNFDGGEWKYVPKGTCEDMHGKLEPFEGVNTSMTTDSH